MARAEELILGLIPVVGAPQVGTLRAEGYQGIVRCFTTQAVAFSLIDFPAVHAIAAEGHLHRGIGS